MDSGGAVFDCEQGLDLEKVFEVPCILNIHGFDQAMQEFLIHRLLALYYHSRKSMYRWKLQNVMVIHEAKSLIRRTNPNDFLLRMVREIRNFGMGFCFLTQSPHTASTDVLSNISSLILFRLGDEPSVDTFRMQLNLAPTQRTALMNLPLRRALVKRPDIHQPFIVSIPNLL